jgi:hypothetical protein
LQPSSLQRPQSMNIVLLEKQCSAHSQKIPLALCKSTFHHRVPKRQPQNLILTECNTIHNWLQLLPDHFLAVLQKGLFSSEFQSKTLHARLISSCILRVLSI